MKNKAFNRLIQKFIRFYHRDIYEELDDIKRMINDVNSQMQELQHRIRNTNQNPSMWLSEYDDNNWV